MGVIKFDRTVTAASKLDFDESPYIYLTANPRYLDVLCVSCYECVPLSDVDHHSSICRGLAYNETPKLNDSGLQLERDLMKTNDQLDKLSQALRNRLVEIELEDTSERPSSHLDPSAALVVADENETLSEKYSNLYAYALKVKENNEDPNGLLIMQRILEEAIKVAETQFRIRGYRYERIVGLQMFSRRLSQINNDKFQILLSKFSVENNDRFDTLEKEEWNEAQE
jgi:hypothetical protein